MDFWAHWHGAAIEPTALPAPVRSPPLLFQIILGQVCVQLHGAVCHTYCRLPTSSRLKVTYIIKVAGVEAVRAMKVQVWAHRF